MRHCSDRLREHFCAAMMHLPRRNARGGTQNPRRKPNRRDIVSGGLVTVSNRRSEVGDASKPDAHKATGFVTLCYTNVVSSTAMARMQILAAFLSLCIPIAALASGQKELHNDHGTVSYRRGDSAAIAIAPSASTLLHDRDYAITGVASLASVILPDSSRITLGADTTVQLARFDNIGSTARFVVVDGKTRFRIEHPAGKPANYTFVTPTATVGVRGTEGDIGVDGKNLTVNVYGLSDPQLPVEVTTQDGKHFTLHAGQQLIADWVNGQIQSHVQVLTTQAVAAFSELGAPISDWASAVRALQPCSAIKRVVGGLFGHVLPVAAPPCPSPPPLPSPSASSSPSSHHGGRTTQRIP